MANDQSRQIKNQIVRQERAKATKTLKRKRSNLKNTQDESEKQVGPENPTFISTRPESLNYKHPVSSDRKVNKPQTKIITEMTETPLNYKTNTKLSVLTFHVGSRHYTSTAK